MPRKNYPKRQKPTSAREGSIIRLTPRQISTCQSKKRYSTEKTAKRELETREISQPNLVLGTYLCPICNGWHLTSKG